MNKICYADLSFSLLLTLQDIKKSLLNASMFYYSFFHDSCQSIEGRDDIIEKFVSFKMTV